MSNFPKISDAEWTVMRAVWQNSPITAKEIAETLSPKTGWKPKTIMTLLNRLVKKGALSYEKHGRAFHFFPLVEEADCVREESKSFIGRVYDGAVKPMLVNFIENAKLSKKDIDELKKILDERGKRK